jgi:hypothetical protein
MTAREISPVFSSLSSGFRHNEQGKLSIYKRRRRLSRRLFFTTKIEIDTLRGSEALRDRIGSQSECGTCHIERRKGEGERRKNCIFNTFAFILYPSSLRLWHVPHLVLSEFCRRFVVWVTFATSFEALSMRFGDV